jgi:hypothetical protein
MALQPFVEPWPFFSIVIFFTQMVGLLRRRIRPSQGRYLHTWLRRRIRPSQGRYLHTWQHKHRINAHTSMPWVGFETTILTFERSKTVHALDRAATVELFIKSNFNIVPHCTRMSLPLVVQSVMFYAFVAFLVRAMYPAPLIFNFMALIIWNEE